MEPSPKKNCTLASRVTSAHEHVTTQPNKRPRLEEGADYDDDVSTVRTPVETATTRMPNPDETPQLPDHQDKAQPPKQEEDNESVAHAGVPRDKPPNWARNVTKPKEKWKRDLSAWRKQAYK